MDPLKIISVGDECTEPQEATSRLGPLALASEFPHLDKAIVSLRLLPNDKCACIIDLRSLAQLPPPDQFLQERVQQRTRELEEANRQLRQKNSMLEKLALTDALTGVPNRRAMDHLVRSEQGRRARSSTPVALGLVDADHFKDINSRYLLSGGDDALIALGRILVDSVRAADTVGRIGGEEFMVLAPETGLEGAATLAERMRAAVEQVRIPYRDQIISLTVSVGFAVAGGSVLTDYEHLKHVAASALGEAKSRGRNCCVIREVTGPPVDAAGETAESASSGEPPAVPLFGRQW